ncbi:MAG: S41 family peptidase, partial [Acidimicrobiia bacterium]
MGVVMNASEDRETESSLTRDQEGENRRRGSLGPGVVILFVVGLVFVVDMVQSPAPEQTTIASTTTTIASEPSTGASLTPMWQAVEHLEDAYGDRLDRPELATAALAFLKGVSEASLDPQDPLEPIPEGVPAGFEQVWQLWRKIELEKTEIESRDLMVQTIEAMVERTGDPGAAVLVDVTVEPDGYVEDALYGIGAFVVPVEGLVVISQPFPGSPASKAGIRPGDVIREVDGVSVADIGLEEVVKLIRGPAGTTVSLVLQRAGSDPVEVEVTRETLELGTARFTMHPGGIGYLSVNSLEARTPAEVHDILESLKRRDMRALILDLRGNT